jgi:hypothetical protein
MQGQCWSVVQGLWSTCVQQHSRCSSPGRHAPWVSSCVFVLATNNRTAAPLNQNTLLVDYVSRIGCAVGDSCRKPASGMWDYMVQHCNDGIQPGERQIYCNGCKQSQHKCHPASWYMWTPLSMHAQRCVFQQGLTSTRQHHLAACAQLVRLAP